MPRRALGCRSVHSSLMMPLHLSTAPQRLRCTPRAGTGTSAGRQQPSCGDTGPQARRILLNYRPDCRWTSFSTTGPCFPGFAIGTRATRSGHCPHDPAGPPAEQARLLLARAGSGRPWVRLSSLACSACLASRPGPWARRSRAEEGAKGARTPRPSGLCAGASNLRRRVVSSAVVSEGRCAARWGQARALCFLFLTCVAPAVVAFEASQAAKGRGGKKEGLPPPQPVRPSRAGADAREVGVKGPPFPE